MNWALTLVLILVSGLTSAVFAELGSIVYDEGAISVSVHKHAVPPVVEIEKVRMKLEDRGAVDEILQMNDSGDERSRLETANRWEELVRSSKGKARALRARVYGEWALIHGYREFVLDEIAALEKAGSVRDYPRQRALLHLLAARLFVRKQENGRAALYDAAQKEVEQAAKIVGESPDIFAEIELADFWALIGDWMIILDEEDAASDAYSRAWALYSDLGERPEQLFSEPLILWNQFYLSRDIVDDYNTSKGIVEVSAKADVGADGELSRVRLLSNPLGKRFHYKVLWTIRLTKARPALVNGEPAKTRNFKFSRVVYNSAWH